MSNAGDKTKLLAVTAISNAGDKTKLLAVTAISNAGDKTKLLTVAATPALRARNCVSAVAQHYSTASLCFHSHKDFFFFCILKNGTTVILFCCHFLENYSSLKLHNMRCIFIICYWPYKLPYKTDKSIIQKGMLQARWCSMICEQRMSLAK